MSIRAVCALLAALAALAGAAPAHAAGKRYALLIGVRDYKERATLGPLLYTENDVEELARLLDRTGSGFRGNVRVLTCTRGKKDSKDAPTAANIRKALAALIRGKNRNDTVLVALAGHGVQLSVRDPNGKKKDSSYAYFCPQDADLPGADYETGRHPRLLLLSDLLGDLADCGAGTKLVLMDACRNELRTRARGLRLNKELVPEGVAALFSCKTGQVAYETNKLKHGVFFHFVIEALKGKARLDRGKITWSALVDYVTEKVDDEVPDLVGGGARQTPHEIKNFAGRSPLVIEKVVRVDPEAERLYRLGLDAYYGLKGQVDQQKALRLLRQAEQRGHALAGARVGWMLAFGFGVDVDPDEGSRKVKAALPALRRKAQDGDADAQSLLGGLYYKGLGVDRNDREATRWIRKAADRGVAVAMNNLGKTYADGRGLDSKDDREAIRWYRKAAGLGLPLAMYNLGCMYEQGQGVEKDYKQAVRWYRQAASKGEPHAMYNLGHAYSTGRGVPAKDDKEALKWYRRAADLGHAGAMSNLGFMYDNGLGGVKKDQAGAARWYRKAADKGNIAAMVNLGSMYESGEGVEKNPAEALRWFKKAAALGNADASNAVKRLQSHQ
jgi:TPR repeat protein